MDIKPINKRASGQAFEVILKPTSPVSDVAHCVTTPPKRDLSLEDIQKKLEAAEDRRRVRMFPVIVTVLRLSFKHNRHNRPCLHAITGTLDTLTSNVMCGCLASCA